MDLILHEASILFFKNLKTTINHKETKRKGKKKMLQQIRTKIAKPPEQHTFPNEDKQI
jgi:hypothetical protein